MGPLRPQHCFNSLKMIFPKMARGCAPPVQPSPEAAGLHSHHPQPSDGRVDTWCLADSVYTTNLRHPSHLADRISCRLGKSAGESGVFNSNTRGISSASRTYGSIGREGGCHHKARNPWEAKVTVLICEVLI